MDFKDFDLMHPSNVLGAAGAVIFVASLTLISFPGFLIGLGLISCWCGATINRLGEPDATAGQSPARPAKPKPVGQLMNAVGICLVLFGLAGQFGVIRQPFAP
jgi:hypothetical protein